MTGRLSQPLPAFPSAPTSAFRCLVCVADRVGPEFVRADLEVRSSPPADATNPPPLPCSSSPHRTEDPDHVSTYRTGTTASAARSLDRTAAQAADRGQVRIRVHTPIPSRFRRFRQARSCMSLEALEPAVTAPNLSAKKFPRPANARPASSRPLRCKFFRLPGPPLRFGRTR